MDEKCKICKVPEKKRGEVCRRCYVAIARGGSCTGVKYPCNFDCTVCMFDQVYGVGQEKSPGVPA